MSAQNQSPPLAPSTRPCGLYRTTAELAADPETIPAGTLVQFHNHADKGTPFIVLPASNTHNRWQFHPTEISIDSAAYIRSLEPRKPEGLYRLSRHFHPDQNHVVPENALVQLGYNRSAEPILFYPSRSETENGIVFPTQGTRIPPQIYELLERLDTRGPRKPTSVH